jgi:type IV pilus assembly protein PilB
MMLSGEQFIEEGLISETQLQLAKDKQRELNNGEPIAKVLVAMGFMAERDRVRCVGNLWGVPFVDVLEEVPTPEALDFVSPQLAKKYKALPVRVEGKKLFVAMSNPLDVFVIDDIRLASGKEIEPLIAIEEDLKQAINTAYKVDVNMSDALAGVIKDYTGNAFEVINEDEEEFSEAELRQLGEDAPIVRLANLILSQAINERASDIHMEPQKDGMLIRFRIDGILMESMRLPRKVVAPLTSRMKIMSEMDIAQKRSPQDNRIGVTLNGKEFDLRVSTLPMIHGEKVVMRVLDKGGINVGLSKLGFLEENLKLVENWSSRTYGIILVTGPTGSGKSTTLYSILNNINNGTNNIITIEDPVEYEIAGINQCGVNRKAGMTFPAGLRAMLRQDPDVIMVGEMRDHETATIAMEAALTGHLVLSTLHTNDAPSAAARLMDMGVEPFLISSSIIGVMAQRLCRQICPKCKQAYSAPREMLLRYGFPLPEDLGSATNGELTLFKGAGCENCKGTGYKGRTGIHELMMMTDTLRDLVLERKPTHVLRNMAIAEGMNTLQMDAVSKILMGITSVDEVLRVIFAESEVKPLRKAETIPLESVEPEPPPAENPKVPETIEDVFLSAWGS